MQPVGAKSGAVAREPALFALSPVTLLPVGTIRSTMDIDLLGRTSNELEHVRALFAQLCDLESEPDGIEYDAKSVKATRIKEDADYEGVRVRFRATLARARIST